MSKRVIMAIVIVLGLCGCANAIEWDAEQEFCDVRDFSEKEGISKDNLLLMSVIPQREAYPDSASCSSEESNSWNDYFINYSICCVFRDGYVYCANEHFYQDIEREAYCLKATDEMWDHLHNVYCIGRISYEETVQLEQWIAQADVNAKYTIFGAEDSYIVSHPVDMRIFRMDLPETGGNIWRANYRATLLTNMPIVQDGTLCVDDPASKEIINWFKNSYFCTAWNRHMKETVICLEHERVTPCLEEEKIRNISDEELLYYGGLAKHRLLSDADSYGQTTDNSRIPDVALVEQYGDTVCIGEFINDKGGDRVLTRYYVSCMGEVIFKKYTNEWSIDIGLEGPPLLFAGLWKVSWKISEEGDVEIFDDLNLVKQLPFKKFPVG